MKPTLFSVLPRPPHSTRDGLAIRNFHLLRALAEAFAVRAFVLHAPHLPDGEYPSGVEVSEFPQSARTPRRVSAAFASFALGGAYSARLYRSRSLAEALSRERRDAPGSWLVAHSYHVGPLALGAGGSAWIDFHNLDSQIWTRMAETGSSRMARAFASWQAPRVRRLEGELLGLAAGVSCVSSLDEAEMRRLVPAARPLVVPNGVDLDRYTFRPTAAPAPTGSSSSSSSTLAFVGDLSWAPNAEGLRWFADRVWPALRARLPGCRVEILGRGVPADLARRAPDWIFLGEGGDTRPLWARASGSIVPLQAGGGTRLKILEAAAAGVPVVSTTVGAEGLEFEADREILLRDDPAGFADAVVRLVSDRAFAGSIAASARARVERDFDWRAIGARFAAALSERAASPRSGEPRP